MQNFENLYKKNFDLISKLNSFLYEYEQKKKNFQRLVSKKDTFLDSYAIQLDFHTPQNKQEHLLDFDSLQNKLFYLTGFCSQQNTIIHHFLLLDSYS